MIKIVKFRTNSAFSLDRLPQEEDKALTMADLLTTRQVQTILQVDRTTIYRLVEGGQLPAIRVGKQWRFARADLDRLLNGQTGAVEPSPPALPSPASLSPSQPAAEPPLRELLPLPVVQMMQDIVAEALGVTVVLTDMQGHPITTVSNPCGLYALLLADADTVTHCIQEWQRLAGAVTLAPQFTPNDLGLLCARGLIRSGNLLKGMVFFGGIAPDQWPPDQADMATIAARFKVAPQSLAPHIDEVYHLNRRQRDHVLSFVQRLADLFSLLLQDRRALVSQVTIMQALLPPTKGQAAAPE